MAINLNQPLRWRTAGMEELAMLADLQGNILKGHGRRATRHLFLEFDPDQARARAFVRGLAHFLVSAIDQLRQAEAFKATGHSGGPFVNVLLSAAGYEALGAGGLAPDGGPAFQEGMRARRGLLEDPETHRLDRGYQGAIHAKILIAGDPDSPTSQTSTVVDDLETRLLNQMSGAARVVASEAGRAIFNANGDGLEHFGYVDGRSQPLLLQEDIDREQAEGGGIDRWNPAFPIGQVLVRDPGSPLETAFGSFFVFRKLEQDVQAFKAAEKELGRDLGTGELAGAMIVGRFEDGTAVELSSADGRHSPISNNFNYAGDPEGTRCPLHGHIRKTNPRGESAVKFGIPEKEERDHIMARRGITYGVRNAIVGPTDEPSTGVGLLFMAFQKDLSAQFEFTQSSWANNETFVAKGVGRDPVIGQGGASILHHGKVWGDAAAGTIDKPFGGSVTMKGGEYFFAPAISTLLAL